MTSQAPDDLLNPSGTEQAQNYPLIRVRNQQVRHPMTVDFDSQRIYRKGHDLLRGVK